MARCIGRALTGAPWWCLCGANPCSLNKFGEMFEQISFGGLSHIPGSPYWPLSQYPPGLEITHHKSTIKTAVK